MSRGVKWKKGEGSALALKEYKEGGATFEDGRALLRSGDKSRPEGLVLAS